MTAIEASILDIVGPDGLVPGESLGSFALDGMAPPAAALPKTREELAALLKVAGEQRLAVGPLGGGTKRSWGNPARRLDLVIGTARLDKVLAYEPADLTVEVGAGIKVAALQEFLGRQRQFLPLNPPLPGEATLGGTLATNSSGPWRLAYGIARDLLLGIEVVLADGSTVKSGGRVVKNVTGYDLGKLFIGSLGTLGIIASATVRVAPVPAARGTMLVKFSDSVAAAKARLVAGSPLEPWALELLDGEAMALLGTAALERALQRVDDGQREWRQIVPSPTEDSAREAGVLAIEFAGAKASVARQMAEIAERAQRHGATTVAAIEDEDAQRALWQAVGNVGRGDEIAFMARMALLPSTLTDALEAVAAAAKASGLRLGTLARAGGAMLYVFAPAHQRSYQDARAVTALAALRESAGRLGGSLVVEECEAGLKESFPVWGPIGPEQALMRRIKDRFDPFGLLNPGRFLGGI